MTTKITVYRRNTPADLLRDHPEERWRCDIYPTGGSDHHGVGATEAEAVLNATMHWANYGRSLAHKAPKSGA